MLQLWPTRMEILGKVLPGKPQGPSWCFGKGRSGGWEHLPSFPPPPLKQLATSPLLPSKQLAAASQPWQALTSMKATHMKATHWPPYPVFFEMYDTLFTNLKSDCFATQDHPSLLVWRKCFCVRFSAGFSESERRCLIPGKTLSGQSCDQKTDNFPSCLML